MDLRKLKTLIDLVESSGIAELEIQDNEERVRITRAVGAGSHSAAASTAPVVSVAIPAPAAPVIAALPNPEEPEGHLVKSPMVGTFYRAASPGSKAFVEVGDTVQEGDALCIIEAMKLMNEIDSEYDGEIVNVYVENGQPVQYGERLFAIRTT